MRDGLNVRNNMLRNRTLRDLFLMLVPARAGDASPCLFPPRGRGNTGSADLSAAPTLPKGSVARVRRLRAFVASAVALLVLTASMASAQFFGFNDDFTNAAVIVGASGTLFDNSF